MLTSYHNHTLWSDGQTDIEGLVTQAATLGLDEVGISDHWVLDPDGRQHDWSMDPGVLHSYIRSVQEAIGKHANPKVRLGLEVDFFPDTIAEAKRRLDGLPFDYVIGSVHYVRRFPVDATQGHWEALTAEDVNVVWAEYYARIAELAASGLCDFVAHLDLPKKFGFRPTADMTQHALAALDAIKANDLAIEINTAGWSLPAAEAYPAPTLLRAARERDIPLLINADAHAPANLTRNFDRARQLARECGYTELVRFAGRERIAYAF